MNKVILNLTDQQLHNFKSVLQRVKTEIEEELNCKEINKSSNYKWKQRAQIELDSLNAIYKQI